MDNLAKYVSVVPSKVQKDIEKMGFYLFIHFGMNTFVGKEWSNGTYPASKFNPTNLSTDDWCEVAKNIGAKGIILTAKHHDGFCLWQTDTTDYSIKNSPYLGGKGDVVKSLQQSCEKYGLKMGLYLSPWDRNSVYYGTDKYDDFYCSQLSELLTNYGNLFTIWLDGACGATLDGKPKQKYDFIRYYNLIRELQPNCSISNCGPDVRWVGNEAGKSRVSEWSVVPRDAFSEQVIMDNSQQVDNNFKGNIDCMSDDIGSRKVLEKYNDFIWYPAEVDVSIRPGWFYHRSQDFAVKSVKQLLNIFYHSYGNNCTLLLNIPPDKTGTINKHDKKILAKFRDKLQREFTKKIDANCNMEDKEYTYTFNQTDIDKVVIEEDIDYSQRIENFTITTIVKDEELELFKGTTIGHKKIALFNKINTDNLVFKIESCRLEPHIKSFDIYCGE